MASSALRIAVISASAGVLQAAQSQESSTAAANPIRKVVTMLQAMQKKVTEEGEKEKELYNKFMCYCKTSGGSLKEAIANNDAKVPQVEAEIKQAKAQKLQLEEDLKQHKGDREAAKAAVSEATSIREKEASAFAKEKAELESTIGSIKKAVAALERGMAGSFVQSGAAGVLKRAVVAKADMDDADRQELLSFLAGGSDYSPVGGEVTGILKEMGDEFAKNLAELTSTEDAAVKSHEELVSAKKSQVAALTESIEAKTARVGETAVSIAQMKQDLSDAVAQLLEDKDFLAELEKGCGTKTAEWEERSKTRAEELVALADTIKVLNDDDALDLFKKTLPSAAASLVQVASGDASSRSQALAAVERARGVFGSRRPRLDLIAMALRGKKAGFEKVIKMVDEMVATLKQEQVDDDHKKEYCGAQLDESDDKRKALERTVSDEEVGAADAEGAIATLKGEIAALEEGIKALDTSVMEQAEQRKAEHEEFVESSASNSAAKELLAFAKNRLNKFYNPKVYLPPPKRELSEEERIATNFGATLAPTLAPGGIAGTGVAVFAQVSAHRQQERLQREAPPPPPETFGAYRTKSQETTGVISMIDLLIRDLEKEMTEAETQEKDAQGDYERLMADAAKQRAADVKSLTDKTAAKADAETHLEAHNDAKASATKELGAVGEYIATLHAECDWLLQHFDARKEARASEVSALGEAKAVLSGAGFSLLQTSTGFLSRA
eukprot:TRINITY_DN5252_c0_g3_i1.p1 TRINITY_DN5252_c0_g3~~TRINITY_DN5252_c0_g3_i1.p1  ORF type:complete len:726 (-),score=305.27 TRINITY_DN5252_c0_g3_i1:62-2239(-)